MIIGNVGSRDLFRGSPQYWERARDYRLGISELDFLSINLRPLCNYRCANCFSGMGNPQEIRGTLTTKETQNLISQARNLGVISVEISGEGEPLMDRRRLEEIVRYNNQLGIITILFTNGSLLNRNFLEFLANNNVSLSVSLDYLNREDYERDNRRYGSFERVINNINLAREIYSPYITEENGYRVYRLAIHSITNARNLEEIPRIAEFCRDDIFYSIAPIANVGNATEHPELTQINHRSIDEIIERYSNGNLILSDSAREERQQNMCGTFFYGIGIRHDGEILFDAHAYETAGRIGNIRNVELGELIRRQRELRDLFYERFGSCFCPLRDPNYGNFVKYLREDD